MSAAELAYDPACCHLCGVLLCVWLAPRIPTWHAGPQRTQCFSVSIGMPSGYAKNNRMMAAFKGELRADYS